MKFTNERPSTKKIATYCVVLIILVLGSVYFYLSEEGNKKAKNARLELLISQSAKNSGDRVFVAEVPMQLQDTTQPNSQDEKVAPPAEIKLPSVTVEIQELLALGARRAKAEATLAARKAEVEEKKLGSSAKTDTPQSGDGVGFLLKDEMPAGMGITFNNSQKPESFGSIEQLTFRFASKTDGKLVTYVSIGENGKMVLAKVGKVINGVKITSINDGQLCASQGKSSRCITMSY